MSSEATRILEHLIELRKRVIYSLIALAVSTGIAFAFHEPMIAFLREPFTRIPDEAFGGQLFVHSVTEGFLVRIRVALLAGSILALPVIVYNILRFVFPGLYATERRTIGAAIAGSSILAVGGFLYSYTQLLPISLQFLTSSGFIPGDVGVLLSYRMSLGFVLQVLLISVLLFQLPVIVVVLMKLDLLGRGSAWKATPYVIVVLVIVSSILTPPDVISQIGLALPLAALYVLAILVGKIFGLGEG